MEVETIQMNTAIALQNFAESGGKLVIIGKEPCKSSGLQNFEKDGIKLSGIIAEIKSKHPNHVFKVDAPTKPLMEWYSGIQKKLNITPYISFSKPDKFLSQVYYKNNDLEIFFISNSSKLNPYAGKAVFNINVKGKHAWRWNPESGERFMLPAKGSELSLMLQPSESQLIVFDKRKDGIIMKEQYPDLSKSTDLNATWRVTMKHVNGTTSSENFSELIDLSKNPKYNGFGGEIVYETVLKVEKAKPGYIDLGTINGVSELYVNNMKAGVVWYGKHLSNIGNFLIQGENKLKVVVTTTLGNYCKSLKDNVVAQRWTASQPLYPCGMIGSVKLIGYTTESKSINDH